MSCPNCSQELKELTLDKQTILHCANCGGSFFAENGINRISIEASQQLERDKKSDEVSGNVKACPRDQSVLSPLANQESIPQDITLLSCPKCRGVFAYADDLVRFKEAQSVKVNYFRLWNLPLPDLKAVLVLTVLITVGYVAYSSFSPFLSGTARYSSASDLMKKIYFSQSAHYILVSFKTDIPLRSRIVIDDKTTNEVSGYTITDTPQTFHHLTITNLNPKDELYYQIILQSNNGTRIKTGILKIQF